MHDLFIFAFAFRGSIADWAAVISCLFCPFCQGWPRVRFSPTITHLGQIDNCISLKQKEQLVAKSSDKPENEAEAKAGQTPQENAPAAPAQRQQIQIDDSKATASYANFCRVTGTPEELIIDFGLNPQPFGVPTQPIPITQRLITNFYTAKRMLHALQLTIQRHEATFGVLETDVQKRVMPAMAQRMQQQQQQPPAAGQ